MPYTISDLGTHLYLELSGRFTTQELGQLFNEVNHLEDLAASPLDRITDLTKATDIALDFSSLFPIALQRSKKRFSAPIKSAFIASQPSEVGMARMFISINTNPLITFKIFSTNREALRWINPQGGEAFQETHPDDNEAKDIS